MKRNMKCSLWILMAMMPQLCSSFAPSTPASDGGETSSSSSSSYLRPSVLCVGETLYDSLPDGLYLGGAPTNVAVHLCSLGTPTALASCVGNDQLGTESIRRLSIRSVSTEYVQRHPTLGTGMVIATIDEKGDARYEFDTPAAWDGLELTNDLKQLVEGDVAVTVMGTIACRLGSTQGATSASTISKIRDLAPEGSVVLDVNLRPPWFDPEFVLALARGGDSTNKKLALVKLNDEELPILEGWCGLCPKEDTLVGDGLKQRMEALGEALNADRVCVTRGENGAALGCYHSGRDVFAEHAGFAAGEAVPGSDTVGAGDSFLAALIRSLLLENETADVALSRACALGGYVASCRGAVPDHSNAPKELQDIFSFSTSIGANK